MRERIGKVSATERSPSTNEKFSFWLAPKDKETGETVKISPFDIVEVDQVGYEKESKTYGIVTGIEHITDSPGHLASYSSSNFGDIDDVASTNRIGTTVGSAYVLKNTQDVEMPVQNEREVCFADAEGVHVALGIDKMLEEDRIPVGVIEMSNREVVPVFISKKYFLGPLGSHLNISGISGLAAKTSFATFFIQSLLEQMSDQRDDFAVVMLNVKHGDLLQIERPRNDDDFSDEQLMEWEKMRESLNLKDEPFLRDTVHYILPRGLRGGPNSSPIPDEDMRNVYAYSLEDAVDKLSLLFADIPDETGAMDALLADIRGLVHVEHMTLDWPDLMRGGYIDRERGGSGKWRDHFPNTIEKMFRHIRRVYDVNNSGILTNARSNRVDELSDLIRNIRGGHTYVVDINPLYEHERFLVFGDVMRTVYAMKRGEIERDDEAGAPPKNVIFFVDELNKYAPKGDVNSFTYDLKEIAERGRSFGVILISAQQFMSSVLSTIPGNSSTKAVGRSSPAEITSSDYNFLETDVKGNAVRLSEGQMLLDHPVFRKAIRIKFPGPTYRQQKD